MLPVQKNKDIVQKMVKLSKRIDAIDNIKLSFVDYLFKYYNFYSNHSKKVKTDMQKFQDLVFKKSFYAIGKCKQIKNLISGYKHFCVYLESVAKVNVVDLKRIDFDMARQQDSLSRKSEQFIKSIWEYSNDQQNSNKIYSEYQSNCQKLQQMMNKFKSYEDPINFYSLNTATDFSKKLDKKFHQCQNFETTLVNNLQVLDQKRKVLSENLKDIKEDYVLLLHNHIANIENVAQCLIDISKDEMYDNIKSVKTFSGTQGDVFSEQIQRFNDKYGKSQQKQDDLINDLKQLFAQQNTNIQISSDYKLFLDRCESLLKSRYQYIDQTLDIQKRTYQQIVNQIQNCAKIEKAVWQAQKQVFKSDGIENFRKMLGKYFGEDILYIAELCLFIVENPRRRYEKMGKIFQKYQQKISKTINRKQQQIIRFKKRVEMVLSEHENVRNQINRNNSISQINANRFNVNVQKTFDNFKKIMFQFSKSEKQADRAFNDQIRKLTTQIKRQANHSLLSYILGKDRKQKQKVQFLHRMNIDSIIISIVKSDTRYQVLFNDPLKSNLFYSFKSQIQKKKFQQTKNILKKKQYQERAYSGQRVVGCCGLESKKKLPKFKPLVTYRDCLIQANRQNNEFQVKGEIQILEKGIMFEQKSRNPFSGKYLLMVPSKQIISARVVQNGQNNIMELLTKMGAIQIYSQKINQMHGSVQKILVTQLQSRDQDSKRELMSDSSSFFKQNNTSTEFKISVLEVGNNNTTKQSSSKNNKQPPASLIFEQLSKKWLQNIFFCQKFKQINDGTISKQAQPRRNYKFKDHMATFIVKEKKSQISSNFNNKQLKLRYQWKISFPEMPMLKSFRHQESLTLFLQSNNTVKITIMEKHRQESHLYVRKIFFSEIDKMNKQVCDFIAKFCERDADVKIDQEASQGQNSTNLDFDQIGINIKDQTMFRKQAQRASRISYSNADKSQAK